MSLEIIKDNTIYYNTALYRAYNLYLIEESKKFLSTIDPTIDDDSKNFHKRFDRFIHENLEQLLEDNKEDRSIEKIFNVMDWEDTLTHHCKSLNIVYKARGIKLIMTIEKFNRKLKLEKLNESNL